jgi:hypothetical protein
MPNLTDTPILVTPEWLDWFQRIWYNTGVNDEKIRQLHERLEAERLAQEGTKTP